MITNNVHAGALHDAAPPRRTDKPQMDMTLSLTTPMFALALALVFAIAVLYASVGHGGGSGYLAALSLLGIPAARMASTALILNLFVAGIGLVAFFRAGHLSGRLTRPFLIGSAPAAVLGGWSQVSPRIYAVLLGGCLMVAAWRLVIEVYRPPERQRRSPPPVLMGWLGAILGWISGVVGVGGGIFLSPLLLLAGWATPQQTAASSACFIVVNSAAGLAGRALGGTLDVLPVWPFIGAAFVGGLLGARVGAHHLSGRRLKGVLAVVLLVAAMKLFAKGLAG